MDGLDSTQGSVPVAKSGQDPINQESRSLLLEQFPVFLNFVVQQSAFAFAAGGSMAVSSFIA